MLSACTVQAHIYQEIYRKNGVFALTNDVAFLVVTILSLLGFGGIMYFLYRRSQGQGGKSKVRGRSFDNGKTIGAMRSFARKNSFRFVSPAVLQCGDAKMELDAIVIGYFGVLGVISLGYSGEIYGEAGDDNWLQVAEDGSRNSFPNPITQSSAAVRVIRDALFKEKMKRVPVEVVYVFSNEKAQLALPRSIGPMDLKAFKKLLAKEKYLDDCGLDMDKVEEAVRKALIS